MLNPINAPIPAYEGTANTDTQQYWLDVAWRQLLREDKTLAERLAAGAIDLDTVTDVVTAAARRVLRNPEGNIAEDVAVDDYRESFRKADATEDLYFTAAELRRLLPADQDAVITGWAGSMRYC